MIMLKLYFNKSFILKFSASFTDGDNMSGILLQNHSELWNSSYVNEVSALMKIVGKKSIRFHHIGSTSIPGILAKPIIDILGEVESLTFLDDHQEQVEAEGYLYRGEYGIPGRRYIVGLSPETKKHRVHFHIFQKGDPEIRRHLAFRDYLREHPEIAKEYERLKLDLKDKNEFDKGKYQDGKAGFCESIIKLALGSSYIPPRR
jgi:GrpB-like predicted nucleotidyltransferase (UPF0157 family)